MSSNADGKKKRGGLFSTFAGGSYGKAGPGTPPTAQTPPRSQLPVPAPQAPAPFIVKGRVLRPAGDPVPGFCVKAVDVDLRSEETLGTVLTSRPDGKYEIRYTADQFKRAERGSADLRVYVFEDEKSPAALGKSNIFWNAPPECTIDVVLGGDEVVGPPEFDSLRAILTPLLDGVAPGDLVEDDKHQDITFLTNETGRPREQIECLILAYQVLKKVADKKIQVDIFYGLFREGIPSDLPTLLAQDPELLRRALSIAVAQNIIRSRSSAEIDSTITQLLSESVSQGVGDVAKPTPVGSVLGTVLQKPGVFLEKLPKFDGDVEAFWKNVSNDPALKDKTRATQVAVQLGALTLNHGPMVKALQSRQITDMSDLTDLSQKEWLKMIQNIGAPPPEVPGDTVQDRTKNYVAVMMDVLEETFPTKFFTSRLSEAVVLETGDTETVTADSAPWHPQTGAFLRNNKSFDFTKTRVAEFVAKNPDALKGINNPDGLTTSLSAIQRVHAVAPRFALVKTLLANGIHSSMQISRMGQSAFVTRFSTLLGTDTRVALQVFERAEQVHATAFSLLASFGWPSSRFKMIPVFTEPAVAASTAVEAGIPDLSTLFGSLDVCACDECRSVDGPAAYLVDILHFLNDRKVVEDVVRDTHDGHIISAIFKMKQVPGQDLSVPMSFKDALFERRPDVGEVELNCQNTNTLVPYIDLTIEVLENAVAPLPLFGVKDVNYADAVDDLNSETVTEALAKEFVPPLSEYASITAIKQGSWWVVDEPAYTYTVRRDDTSAPPKIVSRNTQTKGTGEERASNPQYINIDAYTSLAEAIYPWTLPFDLWNATVRTYLAHVDVKRWEVMETLFSTAGSRKAILQNEEIAYERLNLTPFETGILIAMQPDEPWTLWGFSAETLDAGHGIPDPADRGKMITGGTWTAVLADRVDVFLRQSGLEYKELLNLIQLSSQFGVVEGILEIRAKKGTPEDTCELSSLQIIGARSVRVLTEIARFGRLLRRLEGRKVLDLGRAYSTIRSNMQRSEWFTSDGLKSLFISLSHVLRLQDLLPDIEFEVVLALVSKELDSTPYKDYEDEDEDTDTSSFYARKFRNRTVFDKPDKIFTGDPSTLQGKILDQVSAITGALNMSAKEFSKLVGGVLGDNLDLSLPNLSTVYRNSTLSQALGLGIEDYLILLKLYPSGNVFASTLELLQFVERINSLLSLSPFAPSELNYLLRHDFTPDNPLFLSDDLISFTLSDLRKGLQRINSENTFSDDILDENGDLTQKKLAAAGWEPKITTQLIAIFRETFTWTVPVASSISPELLSVISSDIKDRVLYDDGDLATGGSSKPRLSFTGVMTLDQQTTLKTTTGATADFKNAVDALFTAPRNFLSRNARTISVTDYTAPLKELPKLVKIPTTLSRKVYHDAAEELLHSLGALSEDERDALLLGTDPTEDQKYRDAVTQLFNSPDNPSPIVEDDDHLLGDQDAKDLFDGLSGSGGELNTPLRRFTFALQKILPRLKRVLGRQYVTQKLADFLGVESRIMDPLLQKWMVKKGDNSGGVQPALLPLGTIFHAEGFVNSNTNSRITRTVYGDQFVGVVALSKVATLVKRFKLTRVQLRWLFEFRKASGDPTAKWLDFNALPVEPTAKGDFEGWERLLALVKLRDSVPLGETTLDSIFTLARSQNVSMPVLWAAVADKTKWPLQDVTTLAALEGLNFSTPSALQDDIAMTRIQSALSLLSKVGSSASDGIRYAKPQLEPKDAHNIVQTIKSKYDTILWQGTIARPLRNILRDAQRKNLVSYLLVHSPPGVVPIWRDPNDLYAHYLMDVEMGPCQLTSRIKQAISVIQLFVQRCLMNLERGIKANAEYDTKWEEWKTLKRFRVASAARQVFQKPENFLDGGSRDDRTVFFQEMQTALKQEDLTQEVAETALMNYLVSLDQVANLEVAGYYHQLEYDLAGQVAVDILHVIARTRATPSIYFYRTLVDGFTWTSWEKVPVDIAGFHIIPVVWRRRVHIFWSVITEKQEKTGITLPTDKTPVPVGQSYWEIKIAWTERKQGKWLAKTVSDDFILCPKSDPRPPPKGSLGWEQFDEPSTKKNPGRTLLTFKAFTSPDDPSLRIHCVQNKVSAYLVGYFFFDGIRGNPLAVTSSFDEPWRAIMGDTYLMAPTNTVMKNMTFSEDPGRGAKSPTQWNSDGKLWLYTQDFPSGPLDQTQAALSKNKSQVAVLGNTPGTYSIVYPHQDQQFSCQRPFFFLHGTRSFFVEPTDMTWYISLPTWLGNVTKVHPGLLDGSIWDKFLYRPAIPALIRPHPGPELVGPSLGRPSFVLGSGLPVLPSPSLGAIRSLSSAGPAVRELRVAAAAGPVLGSPAIIKPWTPAFKLDPNRLVIPISFPFPIKSKHFKFSLFYHPYVSDFIRNLNRDGVEGLMQRPVQMSSIDFFKDTFSPTALYVSEKEYPADDVDFNNGPMSIYNWELFFHVPLMIAESLSKNQRFAEAQTWFHYIFDPTDTSALPTPQKYWRTKPFFQTEAADYADQAIGNLMRFLATRGNPEAVAALSKDDKDRLEALHKGVQRWRKDPFNPYLIARMRTTAFQKAVVMKYLDNLLAWGDQLFRQDTIEAINEATQLFILAANILGERPAEIPQRAVPRVETYNTLEPKLDDFSNALVKLEELVPVVPSTGKESLVATNNQIQVATSTMLYFCIPKNDKLLGYWDIVADRLFKIRNCMNLQGIVRELALFEPPIDPAVLVKASASGVDLSSVLNDLNAPLPYHRYVVMAGKAQELCNELKTLGQAILSAIEKKDAEQLSILRSTHERNTLAAIHIVKEKNIEEAATALAALQASRLVVSERLNYYSNIAFLNPWESAQLSLEGSAVELSIAEAALQTVAGAIALIPELKIGAPTSIGATFGGQNISSSINFFAGVLGRVAGIKSKQAGMSGTLGSFNRRADDWALQARLAKKEIDQYDKQIEGANIRLQVAQQELKNHELQQKQQEELDNYFRSKFNNVDLYDWMLAQLSTVYFQSYQLAYDIAKKAERAYAFELGLTKPPDMIQFGYWDSLKKGLLAGEKLSYSLRNMELSYTSLDKREYEITKSVSLLQLDPVALIQLKELGSCAFTVPEAVFDLDFPGHYFRRINTLTLLKSSTRTSPLLSGGVYRRVTNRPDTRFLDSYAQSQDTIATSTGQNDSGMFEPSLKDERYLPFERAGVISSWKLQLPPLEVSQVDINTIQDVIIHMRYTAREAGDPLRSQAVTELRKSALDAIKISDGQTGMTRLFSVRHEFPDAWNKLFLTSSPDGKQTAILPLVHPARFPYLVNPAKSISFKRFEIFIRIEDSFRSGTHSAQKFKFTIIEDGAPADTPNDPLGLVEWQNTLRGAKTFTSNGGNPVNYKITVGLDGGAPVQREAVKEVLLVVFYSVKW